PSPVCDASTFSHPKLGSGVEVLSIAATPQVNYSTPKGHHGLPSISDLSFCRVKVHLAHAGSNDKTLVEIWLPLTHNDWNGRFQATGGGGFATGMFDSMLGPALKHGYAASSTDGGHDAGKYYDDLSWALNPDRTVNWGLLHIFATRSLAEMVIVGKSITEQFYGEKPRYSYWNGCSQGGRQGYAMAQKYPHLLDGILANAPAINLVHVAMGDYWPQIAMKEANTLMSTCELDLFRQKAMEECDMLDGVSDGIISDPDVCDFDPLHVIGKSFYCDGKEAEVTAEMADIVRKIESGPRTPFKAPIWHGLAPGTRTHYLASITISPDGIRSPLPFPISSNFMKTLLLKDPSFNVSELTYPSYMALWAQASYEYGRLLDADDTDLSALRTSGTKLLTWHGINDPVIPYQNTVRYRERVEREMGGARGVDKFYRLFLAPGVEHCAGGAGPVPEDALAALVDWVEKDEPPETLSATSTNSDGDLVTRELCAWPGKLRYMGIGDPKRWSSWTCEGGTERP
ncbi:tannase and feruloyl esterase, partial [Trematosphaeria pertusa]